MRPVERLLTAVAFALVPLSAAAAPCAGFTDVDDASPFCKNVEWIEQRQITLGCAPGLYCPNDPVSRLSMAAFLSRLGDVVLPPNVIWVAKSGGMFQSIQAAIDHAVARDLRPGLVKVAPGTYNEAITMESGIDVEGSGEDATVITTSICGPGEPLAVVRGWIGAQLRHVSVVAWGSQSSLPCATVDLPYAYGAPLRHVKILQSGNQGNPAYGVRATMFGGGHGTPITLEDVEVRLAGFPGNASIGIHADGASTQDAFILRDVRVSVQVDGTASAVRLTNAVATLERVALAIDSPIPSAASRNALLVDGTTADVLVQNSSLRAPGAQSATNAATSATLRIANSLLQGAPSGSMTCFGNYSENLAPANC